MAKRKRGHYFDGDIQDIIQTKIVSGWGPTQIFNHLETFLDEEGKNRYPPNVRTIQRMTEGFVSKDRSGSWSITNSAAEDARLVLDVLADGIAAGFAYAFTKTQADWIVKVRKAAPDAPNSVVFFLALLYLVTEEGGTIDVRALDGYLAFTPWKDRDCLRRYKRAVIKKKLPQVPMWSVLVSELFKSGLVDPRFTGNADTIGEFEKDVYERSNRGVETSDLIASMYDIHPEDVKDIVRKYEEGGSQ